MPEEAEVPQEESEGQQRETENELRPVASSMVDEVGYDEEGGELVVVFASGRSYQYPADRGVFEGLLAAPSVGRFLWDEGFLGGG